MYALVAYLHLLAAIVWLGGTLFIGLVLVPVTTTARTPSPAAASVLRAAARRFRAIAWGAIAALVLTGLWLLLQRVTSPLDILTGPGQQMQTLRLKVTLVALALVLSGLHDFVLGPRLASRLEASRGAASANNPGVMRGRRLVAWIARVNALILLLIVALGVALVR